jgi:cell division protease FtsH
MSKKIGPISWGEEEGEVFLGRELTKMKNYSQETAKEIDSEIKNFILTSYEKAKNMLNENKERLKLLAIYLYNIETIDGKQFKELMKKDLEDLRDFVLNNDDVEIKELV